MIFTGAVLAFIFVSLSGEVTIIPYSKVTSVGDCARALADVRQKYPAVHADCLLLRKGEEKKP